MSSHHDDSSNSEDYTSLLQEGEGENDYFHHHEQEPLSPRRQKVNQSSRVSNSLRKLMGVVAEEQPETQSLLEMSDPLDDVMDGVVVTDADKTPSRRLSGSNHYSHREEDDEDDDNDTDDDDEDGTLLSPRVVSSSGGPGRFSLLGGRSPKVDSAQDYDENDEDFDRYDTYKDDGGMKSFSERPYRDSRHRKKMEGFGCNARDPSSTTIQKHDNGLNAFQSLMVKLITRGKGTVNMSDTTTNTAAGVIIGQGLAGMPRMSCEGGGNGSLSDQEERQQMQQTIVNLRKELKNSNLQLEAWKGRANELQKEVRRLKGLPEDDDDYDDTTGSHDHEDEVEWHSTHDGTRIIKPASTSDDDDDEEEEEEEEDEPQEGILINTEEEKPIFDPLQQPEKPPEKKTPSEYEKDMKDAFGTFVDAAAKENTSANHTNSNNNNNSQSRTATATIPPPPQAQVKA